jgi:arylsulfatase A-like enzyme
VFLTSCLSAFILVSGCCDDLGRTDRHGDPSALYDDAVVVLDRAAPRRFLDGPGGALFLGQGWFAPHEEGRNRWSVSWVIGDRAETFFPRPALPDIEFDFFAKVRPFSFDGAPQQTIRLVLNGDDAGMAALEPGWQEIRVPLERGFRQGTNSLDLEFGYAVSPATVGFNNDPRQLSAAFRELAIIPRRIENAEEFLRAPRIEADAKKLSLPEGGAVAIPLPPNRNAKLNLKWVFPLCRDCRLEIALLTPNDEELSIWEGPAFDANFKSLDFTTPGAGVGFLTLRVSPADPTQRASGRVEIAIDDRLLDLGERTTRARSDRDRPHIFLYTIDTLRADAIHEYGSPHPTSPNMDRFAQDSVTYRNAWSTSAWSVTNGSKKFSETRFASIGTRLQKEGYDTVAISQSPIVSAGFGADLGFQEFFLDDHLNAAGLRSQHVRQLLLHWLHSRGESIAPIFAYLHTVDPHSPYYPRDDSQELVSRQALDLEREEYDSITFSNMHPGPSERQVAHLRSLYDEEVRYADHQFGRLIALLKHLRLYDSSVIVVLSDHGEEFTEHGGFDHGRSLYEEMIHVPLIIKYPYEKWRGTRIAHRASTVDLATTLLELANARDEGAELDGESLLPRMLEAFDTRSERVLFAEVDLLPGATGEAANYQAIGVGPLKCIKRLDAQDQPGTDVARWQFFDLEAEPAEQEQLPADDPRALKCRELLESWVAEHAPATSQPSEVFDEVDEAEIERLKALGYIE